MGEITEQLLDRDTITEIFAKYRKDVFGLCYYYLRHSHDSADTVMEVFEAFLKYTDRNQIQNPRAWLLETARRSSLSKVRKRKKLRDLIEDQKSDESFMESSDNEHLLYEERLDNVIEAVKELKEDQRSCIELFYLNDMSYQDVALHLDLPQNSVKSHIQNAKRNLKIRLGSR